MKKDIIRSGALALALVLGAAVATPSVAQPSQPASFQVMPVG